VKTFWLSMHVPYACRHAGACCSSGWAIPLETTRVQAIRGLREHDDWLIAAPGAPPEIAGVLALSAAGHCVFHGPECQIQHRLGHAALPSACQHFPRECLIDARGVFVTLSHYCPTAAELLFEHSGGVEIVDGPAAVANGAPEGLDARDALPPLLTPGMLMDLDGYAAWEAHAVHVLAGVSRGPARSPEASLQRLDRDARTLAHWRPGGRSLSDAVQALAVDAPEESAAREPDWDAERSLFDVARQSLPPWHQWPEYPSEAGSAWVANTGAWSDHAVAINRFLAAHCFAAWMAYQGNGLLSLTRRLHLALAVLRAEAVRRCAGHDRVLTRARLKEAFRQTDLLLVHLADRSALAGRLANSTA
jgi:hypothetical protein